jgi:DNA-binding transcriptional MocR family regulator
VYRPVGTHSPIPIRRQLTEPHKHVTEGRSAPRNQTLPSRKLVGFLGISPNTRVHAIEDLKRSGYRQLLPLTAATSAIPVAPGLRAPPRETLCSENGFRQRVGESPVD